jgi:predicted transcriptional regulator
MPKKITVELDAELVESLREACAGLESSDAAIIERALDGYLLLRILDDGQPGLRGGRLSEQEANELAVEEVRRSWGSDAPAHIEERDGEVVIVPDTPMEPLTAEETRDAIDRQRR